MKVSIITACFNSAGTVMDCIRSVNDQSYSNIEHIIIDGASSDGTVDLIKTMDSRVSKIISERDKGIYDAMNKGIAMAGGDIIGILNSDDFYFDNEVISDVVKCFSSDPEVDIVYGDLVYVKQYNVNSVVRIWKSGTYKQGFFEKGEVPPHPSVFIRKHVYEKAGVFNLDFKLAADYELLLRFFRKFNFTSLYYPRTLVRMRYGGATNNSIQSIISQNKEILRAWKTNGLIAPLSFIPLKLYKRLTQFFVR